MIKKYKTGGYIKLIEEVECFKETAKSVWFSRNKEVLEHCRKRSTYINFFDTWDEAYQHIYQQAVVKEKALAEAKNYLEKIRDMKFNKESE